MLSNLHDFPIFPSDHRGGKKIESSPPSILVALSRICISLILAIVGIIFRIEALQAIGGLLFVVCTFWLIGYLIKGQKAAAIAAWVGLFTFFFFALALSALFP